MNKVVVMPDIQYGSGNAVKHVWTCDLIPDSVTEIRIEPVSRMWVLLMVAEAEARLNYLAPFAHTHYFVAQPQEGNKVLHICTTTRSQERGVL